MAVPYPLRNHPPKNGGLSKGSVPKIQVQDFFDKLSRKNGMSIWTKVVSHSQPQRCNSKDELRSPTAQLLSWDKKRFAGQQKRWKDICTSTKKKECM